MDAGMDGWNVLRSRGIRMEREQERINRHVNRHAVCVQRFPYVCHGGVVVVAVVVSVDFLSDPCEILIPQNPGTLTLM